MKLKVIIISSLIGSLVLIFSFNVFASRGITTTSAAASDIWSRIGVVSIRKVFTNCKRNEIFRAESKVEQEKAIAELQQLRAEIKAAEAGLETLKAGTKDYLDLTQSLAQKKALLPVKQDYYEQQFAAKDKTWSEQLYKDILVSVKKVAQDKDLALVFEKDEPEFPFERADELMLAVRTNKLLYSKSSVDITADVTALIDANSVKP